MNLARTPWTKTILSRRNFFTLVLLGSAVVLLFLLRWQVLHEIPFPPSQDAGSDLYVTRLTLGDSLPHSWIPLQPPDYYLFVEVPVTDTFTPFAGVDFVMALMPALLVFPGYLLAREVGAGRISAILGGTFLAISTDFSLMATWNGGSNLFAILFLCLFLTFFIRLLRWYRRIDLVLSGVFLSLVAGTHELTFTLALIIVAYTTVGVAFSTGHYRKTLIAIGLVLGLAAALSVVYVSIYLTSIAQASNLGVGDYVYVLQVAYNSYPTFAWGFQGPTTEFLAWFDAVLGPVALLYLWIPTGKKIPAAVLTSVFFAALTIPLLDAANAARGVYFLPIALVIPIPLFFEDLSRFVTKRIVYLYSLRRTTRDWSTRPSYRTWSLSQRLGTRSTLFSYIAAWVAILVVLVPNAQFSVSTMQQSERFYSQLSQDSVNVLNWIKENTSSSSVIYDTAGISGWIWGYSDRWAYAPGPLGGEVTTPSYNSRLLSDYVFLGQHLIGDDYLYVASNYPSPHADPQVYLHIAQYWLPLEESESSLVRLDFEKAGTFLNLTLSSASFSGVSNYSVDGNGVGYVANFTWPEYRVGASEVFSLQGQDLRINWIGLNTTIVQVDMSFNIAPSGYYYAYVSIPRGNFSQELTDSFLAGPDPFSLTFAGADGSQAIDSGGWIRLHLTFESALYVNGSGIVPISSDQVSILQTSSILVQLQVNYLTVNFNSGYDFYLRALHQAFSSLNVTQVYSSGQDYVFQVVPFS